MRAQQVIYSWDCHHGQATRVIVGGLPPLRGATMVEKQDYFLGHSRPVGLITLWEPLEGVRGARVANFYAPQTTGRTPSGTGLSARVAIEVAAGRLAEGEMYVHESLLGLRFSARPVKMNIPRADGGAFGVVPAITARSFLVGTAAPICSSFDDAAIPTQ